MEKLPPIPIRQAHEIPKGYRIGNQNDGEYSIGRVYSFQHNYLFFLATTINQIKITNKSTPAVVYNRIKLISIEFMTFLLYILRRQPQ